MKLIFAGDTVIQDVTKFYISQPLKDFIKQHDFKILNFEGTLKGKNPTPIKKIGPTVFNSEQSISILKDYGFNIFTLANNHIVDFGSESCIETINEILKNDIKLTGAGSAFEDTYKPLIIEDRGQKIALINGCHAEFGVYKDKSIPLKAGYAWINNIEIDRQIEKCKAKGCYIIVLPHAGVEYQEIPLPEWRERYKQFIDLGADIVIGTHPHIIQGKEIYKGKAIYYSLGNFSFYNKSKIADSEWNKGLLVTLDTSTHETDETFISYQNGIVDFCTLNTTKENFEKRSQILTTQEEYNNAVKNMVKGLWISVYKPLYEAVPNFINARNHFIKNLIKYFSKKFVFRSRFQKDLNETLLLHNIQIESHRYAAERYLYMKNIEKNGFCE